MEVARVTARRVALVGALARSRAAGDSLGAQLGALEEHLHALDQHARPVTEHAHRFRCAHLNSKSTLEAVQIVLAACAVPRKVEPRLKEGVRNDLASYLESLSELQKAISFFETHPGYKHGEALISRARSLYKDGIVKLLQYFSEELQSVSKYIDPATLFDALPKQKSKTGFTLDSGKEEKVNADAATSEGSADDDRPVETKKGEVQQAQAWFPESVVKNLHLTACKVIASGSTQECIQSYRKSRGEWVEQMLKRLAVEDLSKEEILRMPWELLEEKIGNWIQHIRVTMMVLFVEERKLSDSVFEGLEPHREKVFMDVIGRSVDMLIGFGDAVSDCQKTPEKLFVLLDMYEALNGLMPQIETIFAGKALSPIRERARLLLRRLAAGVRQTCAELESAVEKDTHKAIVADGTVHPLTSYVVNYVKFLFDYEGTLTVLFEEDEVVTLREPGALKPPPTKLAGTTRKILAVLITNLEGKAKAYKDSSLGQVFLMNNVHYMVRAVKKSDAAVHLLGMEWVERHRRIVQQHASNYQRTAWTKILGYLTTQGLGADNILATKTIKERLKAFYVALEEAHSRQSAWSIPEASLREAVHLAVGEVLLPAYAAFLRRCTAILESNSKTIDKYMKYSPEQLESMLQELFMGITTVSSR